MIHKKHKSSETIIGETSLKKTYSRPVIQVYGKLNRLTQGSGTVNGDGGQGMMVPNNGSDPRLKENIVRIGTHPLGIGLYLFDYKSVHRDEHGYGRKFGVMADEVETVMTNAVSVDTDGFKRVNYDMLGITLYH